MADHGIAPFAFNAAIKVESPTQLSVQNANVSLAKNNILGDFDVNLDGIPAVKGAVNLGSFDAGAFLTGESSANWS